MAFFTHQGARLHWRFDGKPELPVLVLGNSLGTDLFMWDRQVEPLTQRFRLLRFDVRGHGASDVVPGDATMDQLGADLLALADHAGVERFAFCGLSLGGMVGQWLGTHAADRLSALVLSNAAPHLPPPEGWSQRMKLAREEGMGALLDMVMPRFFSQPYRDRDEPFYHSMRTSFRAMQGEGYAACCAAIRDADFRSSLGRIGVPTLVISGSLDVATPHEPHGAQLVAGIPGARSVILSAGHIANVEQPEAFSRALLEFL
ncbi:MAG: 3-oxoadipate enol-lactonase [Gammaproteobacteria bacterium]|nr:3-oxoadipate enol-lactonase [Gammaproteobacteria bacterium]